MLTRLLLIGLTVAACATANVQRVPDSDSESAIRSQLDRMLAAWKADDLEAHIAPYADDATWTTSTGLLEGKPAIRETLTKGFRRGNDLVGHLTFGPTAFTRLGPDYLMTNGSFHLDSLPSGRTIDGQSTLIWRRSKGRWEIIHDHSS